MMAFATGAPAIAQTMPSKTVPSKAPPSIPWIRHLPTNRGVIIFVHGVTGNERTTWTSGNEFWPSMLTRDSTFDGQNIYVYGYPSPRFNKALSIDELAENMRLVLETEDVLHHDEITFVSHSMGGLITRAFILKNEALYRKFVFCTFLRHRLREAHMQLSPVSSAATSSSFNCTRCNQARITTWAPFKATG
jgi:pimeloyl-ACP methyl ester carboxylesterase